MNQRTKFIVNPYNRNDVVVSARYDAVVMGKLLEFFDGPHTSNLRYTEKLGNGYNVFIAVLAIVQTIKRK